MSKKMKVMKSLCTSLVLLFLPSLLFINISSTSSTLTFKVEPVLSTAHVGGQFTVQVNAYDAVDLYAWNVRMNFDKNKFDAVGIIIAGFLASQPEGATPSSRISNDGGFLIIGETTNGVYPGVDGDGWLCSIIFQVEVETSSVLNIDNEYTYALNRHLSDILPHIKENGNYVPPWPEDVNADGVVDIFDLASVALDLNTYAIQQKDATTRETSTKPWTNPTYVYTRDDNHAYTSTDEAYEEYNGYGFVTTGWTGVTKVEVGVETKTDTGGECQIRVKVRHGAVAWGDAHTYDVTWTTDTFFWVDVTDDFIWTPSMIDTIQVRIEFNKPGGATLQPIYVDWLPVRVTPEPASISPFTDINGDGKVRVLDLTLVSMQYGRFLE